MRFLEAEDMRPGVCRRCRPPGWRILQGAAVPCECTWRMVCRRVMRQVAWGRREVEELRGGDSWARHVEYGVDADRVACQALDRGDYEVWRLYYLVGLRGRSIEGRLGMPVGRVWHAVYRAEARLGRAYVEAGLYPIGWYYRRTGTEASVRGERALWLGRYAA